MGWIERQPKCCRIHSITRYKPVKVSIPFKFVLTVLADLFTSYISLSSSSFTSKISDTSLLVSIVRPEVIFLSIFLQDQHFSLQEKRLQILQSFTYFIFICQHLNNNYWSFWSKQSTNGWVLGMSDDSQLPCKHDYRILNT